MVYFAELGLCDALSVETPVTSLLPGAQFSNCRHAHGKPSKEGFVSGLGKPG